VYVMEIIKRLVRDTAEFILIEQINTNKNILRKELSIQRNQVIMENGLPLRLLSYMPIGVELNEKSIVHSSYYRICRSVLAANIITVYDFNYELGYVRRGIRKYLHCRQKRYAIEMADGVICISESTKRDLLRFFPHVNQSKLKVIHLAAGGNFSRFNREQATPNHLAFVAELQIGRKYILYVGARIFHKNFDVCIETLRELTEYDLYIVGSIPSDKEVANLDSALPSRYRFFSNLGADELNCLYNNAFCFLYPSSYEGFGIPLLEAMQAGCPVVSTRCSSIPEVVGEAGLLVDNVRSDDFVQKVRSLENEVFRDKLILAGLDQAKKFSWNKTYEETIKFYNEVFLTKFLTNRVSV
jgi:glycosyltransferase involved in cell wall biosynthesis